MGKIQMKNTFLAAISVAIFALGAKAVEGIQTEQEDGVDVLNLANFD